MLKKASQFGAKTAYIFVTNQKSDRNPQGHEKDPIFLAQLLAKWIQQQKIGIKLEYRLIPNDKNANKLEPMLDFYETTLAKIRQTESLNDSDSDDKLDNLVLVSIKGGTNAMGTALQLQSMDAGFQSLVFIDPELSLQRILAGKPDECKLTIYWRQLHSQKYRTVRQLLNRWDFDGAISVLTDWQTTLSSLPNEIIEQVNIAKTLAKIKSAIATLKVGVCFFNLDRAGAKKIIDENSSLNQFKTLEAEYSAWLNLYEQCRIYWELNQLANCLARMTSFWEESLCVLIVGLGGEPYFVGNLTDWKLDKKLVESQLWDLFAKKERRKNYRNFKNWDFDNKPYPLFSLFSKQRFAEAMVKITKKILQKKYDSLAIY